MVFFLKHAEQSVLAHLRVALRFLRLLHGFIQHGHELCAIAEVIHGAGLDQRLQHATVQHAQVNFLAELKDGAEAAQFFARRYDGLNRVAAHVLHRGQSKTNCIFMRREERVTYVHVRRLNGNTHFAAFIDVLHHVVRVACLRREQRRHELNRIMRLEISRVIRQQCVRGGM